MFFGRYLVSFDDNCALMDEEFFIGCKQQNQILTSTEEKQ
jgi:hypothetical protein